MTDRPRITIDAPDGPTILAARHLDATEGRVQVGTTVDTATRAAITRVLGYVAKAHNSPAADTPASTAPAAAAHPIVQGRCPACRGQSLFLGSGGHVTCARLDCPNPSAADEQMHGESVPATAATEATGDWKQQNDGTWTIPFGGCIISMPAHVTAEERTRFAAALQQEPDRVVTAHVGPGNAPAEHCGHLSPGTLLTSLRTECVLRPGHTGSHADDRGCRWWPVAETD